METINEIRRIKLLYLIEKFGGVKPLADTIEKSPSQVSQWANALPDSRTGKPRQISTLSARHIEKMIGETHGWMDRLGGDRETQKGRNRLVDLIAEEPRLHYQALAKGPDIRGRVPLISWVQAGDWCEAIDNFHPGDAEEWLPCPFDHGEHAFCLTIAGPSMEPDYRDGEVILVDPAVEPRHDDDVVARTPDGRVTFKRLQVTPEGTYLMALNADWRPRIIEIPEGSHICGVVIGSWMRRRR